MELIGWIGSTLFALCGLPQAIECAKSGHSRGLSWGFLLMWLGGEICTIAYVLTTSRDPVLLSNYLVNLVFLAIMLRYKLFERN